MIGQKNGVTDKNGKDDDRKFPGEQVLTVIISVLRLQQNMYDMFVEGDKIKKIEEKRGKG